MSSTLPWFDPATQLHLHSNVYVLGPRKSGKSVLMRDLLHHMRNKISKVDYFSPHDYDAPLFGDFVNCTVRESVSDAILKGILDSRREMYRASKGTVALPAQCIVLDDCFLENSVVRECEHTLKDLFINGRHFGMTTMRAEQYPSPMPEDMRSKIDFVFYFRSPQSVLDRISERVFNLSKADLLALQNQLCEDEALVYNCATLTFYKYKATLRVADACASPDADADISTTRAVSITDLVRQVDALSATDKHVFRLLTALRCDDGRFADVEDKPVLDALLALRHLTAAQRSLLQAVLAHVS